jgi:ribose 5-phosphate isomerase B
MKIACGFDHAGVPLREPVVGALTDAGYEVLDVGAYDDYPYAAVAAGRALAEGAARAVLVCGSGAGVAVAASKLPGVRAATVHDAYTAHQSVEHDDLNVLCLGARVIGAALAREIVVAFAGAVHSPAERHARRLSQVAQIERAGLDALSITRSGGEPPR